MVAALGCTVPGNTLFVQMGLKRDPDTPTSMFGHQAHSSLRLKLPRFSGSKITFLKIDFFQVCLLGANTCVEVRATILTEKFRA